MEKHNFHLEEKYNSIRKNEVRFEEINTDDADYIFVAYGLSARICMKAMDICRKQGMKVGLFRPITLFPFPYDALNKLADKVTMMMTMELNAGQMVEDVKLAVNGKIPVDFYGRMGGMIPTPEEIVHHFENVIHPTYAN